MNSKHTFFKIAREVKFWIKTNRVVYHWINEGWYVSESTVYRILKREELIKPAEIKI